ncbi:hypothetical protein ACS0TY_005686 [Phlomoides rotata]
MAEADPKSNPQRPQKHGDEQKLKYLGFVLVAVLHVFMLVAKLYSILKENLGPLKPGINAVENTVRSFVAPVWGKFDNVPFECLKFVDRKIDMSVKIVQRRVPKALKRVSRRAFRNAKKAPVAARSVMCDVKNTGMAETASGLAKDMYAKYEPVTEQYASSAWHFLNQYTLVHRAVQNLSPIATRYSEMYNEKVQSAAEKGYKVASHLPLVPTEKITKVLSDGNVKPVAEATHEEAVATQ